MAQPHPALVVAGLVVMTVVAASLTAWCCAVAKLTLRQPLVEWSERRPVPWGAVSLLIGMFLPALALLGDSSDPQELSLTQRQGLIAVSSGVSLAILVLVVAVTRLLNGATTADLGWSWRDLWKDLRLGVVGFVMLALPVYAIQGVLVYWWKPSQHPLMELFKTTPDAGFFALLFFAAAVVAPLFEEVVFRVLLQGFLEKLCGYRGPLSEYVVGLIPARVPQPVTLLATEMTQVPLAIVPEPSSQPMMPPLRGLRAVLPIAISSLIFALLHYSHGPDWVPLLLLAAGMGYLYQRTHRIVPSLVVHALLNSFSMGGLWIQVYVMPEVEGVHGYLCFVLCCILGSKN